MPIKPRSLESVRLRAPAPTPKKGLPTSHPGGFVGVAYIPKGGDTTGRPLVYVDMAIEIYHLLDWLERGGQFNLSVKPRSVVTIADYSLQKLFKGVPAVKELVIARFPDYADREKRYRQEIKQFLREWDETEDHKKEVRQKAINLKSAATRKANAAAKAAAEAARLANPSPKIRHVRIGPYPGKLKP